MTKNQKTNFAGTYFNRDSILRLARIADIFAWATLIYYAAQSSISAFVFILQIIRGLAVLNGPTDYIQQFIWQFQPFIPGLFYFVGIQAIGYALLILMDIEDDLRRAARNKS
jgi:hypothetical protein